MVGTVHHAVVAAFALDRGLGIFDFGRVFLDLLAADGVRTEAVAIVDEVGNVVDVVADAPGTSPQDFTRGWL